MEKKRPGRPKGAESTAVSVLIHNKHLFKMREMNRSYFINSLLEKHFNEEAKGAIQQGNKHS